MDPAIQTNLNGINTLGKRLAELRSDFSKLSEDVENLGVDELTEQLEYIDSTVKLNATRIANLRKLDYNERLDGLKSKLDLLATKLSNAESVANKNANGLKDQESSIKELRELIVTNALGISANANDIKINSDKNVDTLGSIETVSTLVEELEKSLATTAKGLLDTDKVIEGCIIGIDNNNKQISNVSAVAVENRTFIIDSQKAINAQKELLAKHTENIDLNAVQTKTNSVNIRTLSQRK